MMERERKTDDSVHGVVVVVGDKKDTMVGGSVTPFHSTFEIQSESYWVAVWV